MPEYTHAAVCGCDEKVRAGDSGSQQAKRGSLRGRTSKRTIAYEWQPILGENQPPFMEAAGLKRLINMVCSSLCSIFLKLCYPSIPVVPAVCGKYV